MDSKFSSILVFVCRLFNHRRYASCRFQMTHWLKNTQWITLGVKEINYTFIDQFGTWFEIFQFSSVQFFRSVLEPDFGICSTKLPFPMKIYHRNDAVACFPTIFPDDLFHYDCHCIYISCKSKSQDIGLPSMVLSN